MAPIQSYAERFAVAFTEAVTRRPLATIAAVLLVTAAMASNALNLGLANNYRIFFSKENPELSAFEAFQATYTKNDNFTFVVEPRDGDVFTPTTLSAVEDLTAQAWSLPFTIRVDSITNFQSTRAEGDDLIVEDLFRDALRMDPGEIAARRAIAVAEPVLLDQLVTANGAATAVNVVLQYPDTADDEIARAAAAARALRSRILEAHPQIDIRLTGVSMLNNAIIESSVNDALTLTPLMYLVVLISAALVLRSAAAVLPMVAVITGALLFAMGGGGLMAIELTGISLAAPTVIMTLAVADCVHILLAMRAAMSRGMEKVPALIEAARVNFLPIAITSVTTLVGFLTLNFSDAPPFAHLGNITAFGIFAAWALSLTLLPALVTLLPFRAPRAAVESTALLRLADWVIAHHRAVLVLCLAACVGLVSMISRIEYNDQWVQYFDERIEFRTDSDQAAEYFGLYPVEFSVPAGESGGVSDPAYLQRLDAFAEWLRAQPHVTHVYSLSDVMQRLNRNMHGDDDAYYRLPEDRELSAQYLLFYELSLPYGLGLNDRVDIDKSASRLTATLGDVTTLQTKAFIAAADEYIEANFPVAQRTTPTSAQVMFTYITDRNVDSMITGTVIAVAVISAILLLTLRSLSLGLLSLVSNGLPILVTFGAWGVLVGEVGLSVASVASISLGIVVDDTVHLLAKFQRARRELAYSVEDAIRYAFTTVGEALVITTGVLMLGFFVLTLSSFKLNVDLGLMGMIAIAAALVLDLLLVPALLLVMHRLGHPAPARSEGAGAEHAPLAQRMS